MTPHPTPDELVNALDGVADARVGLHLDQCASCRRDLEEMNAVWQELKMTPAGVPEPPAGFWRDLHERLRDRTASERPVRFGRVWPWRSTLAAAAALAAVFVWQGAVRPWERPAPQAVSGEAPAAGELTWDSVNDLASSLTVDDVRLVLGATPDSTVGDLSAREREAFVRLIDAELGASR